MAGSKNQENTLAGDLRSSAAALGSTRGTNRVGWRHAAAKRVARPTAGEITTDTSIVSVERDDAGGTGFSRDPFVMETNVGDIGCFSVPVTMISGRQTFY